MLPLVRSTILNGYTKLVTENGGDAELFLDRAKISPDNLDNIDAFFPYSNFGALLEISAAELQKPDFGLTLAMNQDQAILGPVAFLALSSKNLKQAILEVSKSLHHLTPAVALFLRYDQLAHVCLDLSNVDYLSSHQSTENAIGATFSIFQKLLDNNFNAESIWFTHRQIGSTNNYETIFGCPVHFEKPSNSINVRSSELEKSVTTANPDLHELVNKYLKLLDPVSTLISQDSSDIASKVRHLVIKLMPTARLSRCIVAENLGLHERALHRKLKCEGTTFEKILEETRTEQVKSLLSQSGMPMSQIAGLLGYNEQSSFNRAFKRWYGMSPKEYLSKSRE